MRLPPARHILLGSVIGLVGLAVTTGLWLLGSPREARRRRLDARRVADLNQITLATDRYRTRYERLPVSLEELLRDPEVGLRSRDPTTGALYEYHVLGPTVYEVCAHFERASDGSPEQETDWFGGPGWPHGAGRQCFRREARDAAR
jgi:hypothetical protein